MCSESIDNYKILHLGCGISKPENHFGIDINPRSNANLKFDLDSFPWPLPDNHFEEVHCPAIIEHLNNFYQVFEEIYRVCKNGAKIYISIPHYSDVAAFTDPTHVKYFTSYSFDVLTQNTKWSYYTNAQFKFVKFKIIFLSFWRMLGIQFIINITFKYKILKSLRKFWESYLCFIIRAKSMEIILEVKK